jgi:hypothetical protein
VTDSFIKVQKRSIAAWCRPRFSPFAFTVYRCSHDSGFSTTRGKPNKRVRAFTYLQSEYTSRALIPLASFVSSHQSSIRSCRNLLLPNEHLATCSAAAYNGSYFLVELSQRPFASKDPRCLPKTSSKALCSFSSSAVSPSKMIRSTAARFSSPGTSHFKGRAVMRRRESTSIEYLRRSSSSFSALLSYSHQLRFRSPQAPSFPDLSMRWTSRRHSVWAPRVAVRVAWL